MKKIFLLFTIILFATTSKIHAQYDSIFHWKSGVMIRKQSVKQTDLDSITFRRLLVGQSYKGGVIAYILKAGDPGYVAGQTHGLIAATADQSSKLRWYNGTYITTGATAIALGTGLNNTNLIITKQGNTGAYAAKLCRDYRGGGYTDWFLPSKDELNILYLNKTLIGGFSTYYYWSSTEENNSYAWHQRFSDGNTTNGDKLYTFSVRAVRRF